ncbi:hypothetical protein PHYSODRAFT_420575, partial [Phytophthora sojae]
ALLFKWNFNALNAFILRINAVEAGAPSSPPLPSWLCERPPTITCESLTADIVRRVADTQGPSFDGVVAVADDQRRLSGMRERLSAVEVHPFMQWEMETAGPNDRLAST